MNRTLRSDVVKCTTWGIMDAIGRARQRQSAVTRAAQPPSEDTRCRIHLPRTFSTRGFDCISYGVHLFSELRLLYGIDDSVYEASFVHPATGKSEVVERFTEGKSGSFFYFTDDRRFLVKTVTASERMFLRRHLPGWAEHFRTHPTSLLTRFCGLHAIRLSPEQRWLYFCVMESVFAGSVPPQLAGQTRRGDGDDVPEGPSVVECFDLKGSWVGRSTLAPGIAPRGVRTTLKDGDLMHAFALRSAAHGRALHRQLQVDAAFLADLGVMDYSLLVGVAHLEGGETGGGDAGGVAQAGAPDAETNGGRALDRAAGQRGVEGSGAPGPLDRPNVQRLDSVESLRLLSCQPHPELSMGEDLVLLVGIVDVLQLYDLSKRAERWYKVGLRGRDGMGVSVLSPPEYRQRFISRVGALFAYDDDGGGDGLEAADGDTVVAAQRDGGIFSLGGGVVDEVGKRRRPRPKSESAVLLA
jgi:1-phosphatidylinositol-4-phosphate 5-kinase